jgi:transketolase
MRNAFLRTLFEQAEINPDIWLLCGDIGYSVLEPFANKLPGRFVNVGVAEQNMIGIAAGLAKSGKMVFTYTIGNFAFMRCMEQIRNELCYHNLNVKVVAVGGGFAYGSMGYTHHAVEDLAMLRVLPNLTVVAPGDPVEASLATAALCQNNGPAYLRLGRGGEPVVHTTSPSFALNKAITLSAGKDVTLITSAGTLDIAEQAEKLLSQTGLSVGVVSMPVLSPFDYDTLSKVAANTRQIVTIEEHGRGGLASIVGEWIASTGTAVKMHAICATLPPSEQAGDRAWQRSRQQLTAEAVVNAAK